MKILSILTLCALAIGGLSACQVSARDKDTSVSVSNNDGYYKNNNNDGYFCPPGQAKKGRC